MNIAVICFTEHGAVLAERFSKEFSEREMTCRAWIKKKEAQIPDCSNVQVLTQNLPGVDKRAVRSGGYHDLHRSHRHCGA